MRIYSSPDYGEEMVPNEDVHQVLVVGLVIVWDPSFVTAEEEVPQETVSLVLVDYFGFTLPSRVLFARITASLVDLVQPSVATISSSSLVAQEPLGVENWTELDEGFGSSLIADGSVGFMSVGELPRIQVAVCLELSELLSERTTEVLVGVLVLSTIS